MLVKHLESVCNITSAQHILTISVITVIIVRGVNSSLHIIMSPILLLLLKDVNSYLHIIIYVTNFIVVIKDCHFLEELNLK